MASDADKIDHHGGGQAPHKVDYHKIENHHSGGGDHEEEGEGPWLMSFADMVTLLMCFFILFFQTDKGNIKLQNPDELMEKLEQLQKVLGLEQSTVDTNSEVVKIKTPTGSYGSIEQFKSEVEQVTKQSDLVFSLGIPQPGVVELTFLNTRFFESGSAETTKKAESMLKGLAGKLAKLDKQAELEIEGHTDSDPIKSQRYPSNWELSSARAATVVRILQANGIPPQQMRASGLAHYKPIAPDHDSKGRVVPQNKALNRRIVVRIKTTVEAAAKGVEAPEIMKKPSGSSGPPNGASGPPGGMNAGSQNAGVKASQESPAHSTPSTSIKGGKK